MNIYYLIPEEFYLVILIGFEFQAGGEFRTRDKMISFLVKNIKAVFDSP